MLLSSSNSRGARGQPPNRSRGSNRGRGSTGRGASNSSGKSKLQDQSHIPSGPQVLQESRGGYCRSNYHGRNLKPNYKNHYSSFERPGTSPTENAPNNFDAERLENAAKREQLKDPNGTTVTGRGGRGNSRGKFNNKQVRFAAETKAAPPSKSPSPAPSNPFAPTNPSSPFGNPATMSANPFVTTKETSNSPFTTSPSSFNPFGAPSLASQPTATTNVFGRPPGPPATTSNQEAAPKTNVFGSNPFVATPNTNGIANNAFLPNSSSSTPITNPFNALSGAQPQLSTFSLPPLGSPAFSFSSLDQTSTAETSKPATNPFSSNPFGAPSGARPSVFSTTPSGSTAFAFGSPASGKATISQPSSSVSNAIPFGAPPSSQLPPFSATSIGTPAKGSPCPSMNTFGASSKSGAKSKTNGFGSTSKSATHSKPTTFSSSTPPPATSSVLAETMDQLLRKEGIVPPTWPTSSPGDPKQKGVLEAFWQTSKGYRAKVRAALIRAGFLDDPDKPKKLSEAIDFKGTCEDMCPEFEKITRIVERDVQGAEKELASDGSMWPAAHKMVKALARSAAGQDAPLPMDVRSPSALRRTFDYLLHTVLGEDGDLPAVHGFLWDRTRAIRRDFVFQSSMSQGELLDQVYCLERITRFHVIALHQMSREEVVAEDFSEQQEVEQLGKALLSLIHAYEDCQAQGIPCENEAEFRAYYILFNSHNSGILETVQDWGWKFWGESDQIRIAVSLVETLQNIWDTRGPLKPHSATDIAQNGYSRFFSIVVDKKVSYTMACFAEIHFNGVRKSALKTILSSYRKQRDQTKDWTLRKLNAYLRFDDEEDIIEFSEAYGLQFEESDGETYLSFESELPSDPFPPLKQRYSYCLVERKRGDHSLPTVIDATVYDEGEILEEPSDEESLFVKDTGSKAKAKDGPSFPSSTTRVPGDPEESVVKDFASAQKIQNQQTSDFQKPMSIFNQPTGSQAFGPGLFATKPAEPSPSAQSKTPQDSASVFSQPPAQETPTNFAPTSQPQTKPTPPFAFLNQPFTEPACESSSTPLALEQNTARYPPSVSPTLFSPPPDRATPPAESPKPLSSLGQHLVTASPSIQNQKPLSSLGGHSVASPQTFVEHAPESSVSSSGPAQQSPLPQSTFGLGSLVSPAQNHIVSNTSQASNSQFTPSPAQVFSKKSTGGTSSFAPAKSPTADNRKAQLDNLARWVAVGDGGIIDQFTEHHVGQILRNAVGIYLKETADRKAKEEDDQAREQADQFRYRSLATKYGHKWREAAQRLWQRRRGREARKARQEMARSLRASKALQSANVVEDFRASTGGSRRGSLESLLGVTGVLHGVHDSNSESQTIVHRETPKAPSKKQKSDRTTESPASSIKSHRRGKSDNPLRRSLLSDPTYLHGGSRIHLMSKYDVRDETRRQVSGVQTDYFRLKARGISTLPNGTPLASSAAKDILHQKRSLDGITKPVTPQSLMPPPAARSVPAKRATQSEDLWKDAESGEFIQAMKARARAHMGDDKESRHKKRTFDDDDELFARAKRVREQMDEGSQWYQKQIETDTASRSVS